MANTSSRKKAAGTKAAGTKSASRKKTAAKRKAGSKKTPGRKTGSKRTLLENRAGTFFARRRPDGQFEELDERGRSAAADRRSRAKTVSKKGQGDRGDRRR